LSQEDKHIKHQMDNCEPYYIQTEDGPILARDLFSILVLEDLLWSFPEYRERLQQNWAREREERELELLALGQLELNKEFKIVARCEAAAAA